MSNLLEACIVEAEKSTGIALPNARATLARLERRAKDWAKGAQGGDSYHGEPCTYCDSCNRSVDGRYGKCDVFRPHAHDCDAAIILDLERESAG